MRNFHRSPKTNIIATEKPLLYTVFRVGYIYAEYKMQRPDSICWTELELKFPCKVILAIS